MRPRSHCNLRHDNPASTRKPRSPTSIYVALPELPLERTLNRKSSLHAGAHSGEPQPPQDLSTPLHLFPRSVVLKAEDRDLSGGPSCSRCSSTPNSRSRCWDVFCGYRSPSATQSRATAAVQDWASEPNGSPVKGSKYSAKPPAAS